jgi:transposase
LFERWAEGCHNIACLFRELVERGYKGSYGSVRDNLVRLLPTGRKQAAHALSKTSALPTSRQAAFLFLRRSEKLKGEELEQLCQVRQIDPEVELAYELVQQFAHMLRTRTGEHLDAWLNKVASSKLSELQAIATGIEMLCVHQHNPVDPLLGKLLET